jgi:hypothetical protein
MVEEIPEEDGYWELVEENSSSCTISQPPPEEVVQPSFLPIMAIIGGMVLLGV